MGAGWEVDYKTAALLDLGTCLPVSSYAITHRNPTNLLDKIVAQSPRGDSLYIQPRIVGLLLWGMAAGFLTVKNRSLHGYDLGCALLLGVCAAQVRVSRLDLSNKHSPNCFVNINPLHSHKGPGKWGSLPPPCCQREQPEPREPKSVTCGDSAGLTPSVLSRWRCVAQETPRGHGDIWECFRNAMLTRRPYKSRRGSRQPCHVENVTTCFLPETKGKVFCAEGRVWLQRSTYKVPLLQWVSSAPLWLISSLSLPCDQGNASNEKFIKGPAAGKGTGRGPGSSQRFLIETGPSVTRQKTGPSVTRPNPLETL